MEFVRRVIDSSLLDKISLPQSLRNKRVEIIILPLTEIDSDSELKISVDEFAGALAKYKNPDLISLEKNAWADAVEDKHGNH